MLRKLVAQLLRGWIYLIALIVFATSLYYQVDKDYRFPYKSLTHTFQSQSYLLQTRYPDHLLLPSLVTPQQVLTISPQNYSDAAKGKAFYLIFSKEENLLLKDKDGRPIWGPVEMKFGSEGYLVYIEPDVANGVAMQSAKLSFEIHPDDPNIETMIYSFDFPIESVNDARQRVFGDLVLGKQGVLLSLGLLVIGWLKETGKQRQEERQQVFLEEVEQIRQESQSHLLEALRRFDLLRKRLDKEEESSVRKLDNRLGSRYHSLRQELCERYEEILRELGTLLQQGDDFACMRSLSHLTSILDIKDPYVRSDNSSEIKMAEDKRLHLAKQLKELGEVLHSSIRWRHQAERAAKIAFELWEDKNISQENTKDIIVKILQNIKKWEDHNDQSLLRDRFIHGNDVLRRLLNDDRLTKIAPDLVSRNYNLFSQIPPVFNNPPHRLQDWFNDIGLKANPFLPLPPRIDELPFPVPATESQVIFGRSLPDMIESLRLVGQYFANSQQVVTVNLVLPLFQWQQEDSGPACIRAVAIVIAERWVDLLASNPTAFLDMDRVTRYRLMEFLTWAAGSTETVQLWLSQRNIEDLKEGRSLLHQIKMMTGITPVSKLTQARIFNWMDIRLPGLDTIVLLVNGIRPMDDNINKQAVSLMNLYDVLADHKIFLKLWLNKKTPPEGFPMLPLDLHWSNDQLVDRLGKRFQAASAIGYVKFDDLFGPIIQTPDYYAQKLVQGSHESLLLLNRIGNEVIQQHGQRLQLYDPNCPPPYLTESDLDAVLLKYQGDPRVV